MVTTEKKTVHPLFREIRGAIRGFVEINAQNSDRWGIHDSLIRDYDDTFEWVLEGESIIDMVSKKSFPVVIDLMAPTGTLRDLFGKILVQKKFGLAVSLSDQRSNRDKRVDKQLGIEHVDGDILNMKTWRKIEKKLKGKKVDLIVERGLGGLTHITKDERVHFLLFQRAWDLLKEEGGIMLLEVPQVYAGYTTNVKEWIAHLREKGIKVVDDFEFNGVLKIVKTPDSPKKLPVLQKLPVLPQHSLAKI